MAFALWRNRRAASCPAGRDDASAPALRPGRGGPCAPGHGSVTIGAVPPPELILRHAEALATLRAFGRAAGAERVVLVRDRGDDAPAALLEWSLEDELSVTEGDEHAELPARLALLGRPRELPEVRAVPATAVSVDPGTGELSAPIGAVAHFAESVLALAEAFGGRSVVSADFPTRDPAHPLTVAGRPGEDVVLAVGEHAFALPEAAG